MTWGDLLACLARKRRKKKKKKKNLSRSSTLEEEEGQFSHYLQLNAYKISYFSTILFSIFYPLYFTSIKWTLNQVSFTQHNWLIKVKFIKLHMSDMTWGGLLACLEEEEGQFSHYLQLNAYKISYFSTILFSIFYHFCFTSIKWTLYLVSFTYRNWLIKVKFIKLHVSDMTWGDLLACLSRKRREKKKKKITPQQVQHIRGGGGIVQSLSTTKRL